MATNTSRPRTPFQRLRFSNWRISLKLLFFMLLISLVPLLLAILITTQSSSEEITRQTKVSLSRLAFSTAQRIEQFLKDNHYFISMISKDPAVIALLKAQTKEEREALKPGVKAVIDNLLASNPAIDLVGFYDLKGIVLYHNNAAIIGQDYSVRDYVQAALKGNQFTSGILVGITTGTPGINASAPVKNGDQIIGATAIRIVGRFVEDILRDTLKLESVELSEQDKKSIDILLTSDYNVVVSHSLGKESPWLYRSLGTITSNEVMDRIKNGRLLGLVCPNNAATCDASQRVARIPDSIPSVQPLANRLGDALQRSESGSLRYCQPTDLATSLATENCDGNTGHVVGFAPVKDPYRDANMFMVVVDIPESIFLQALERQRLQGIALAGGLATVAVLIALFLARTLAKPIGRLASAAVNVENDKPFEPRELDDVSIRGDEVGNLSRVFSAMVMALRARVNELRTIYEIGNTINSAVELGDTLKYISSSIGRVISFDGAEICLYNRDSKKMVMYITADPARASQQKVQTYSLDQGYIGQLIKRRQGLLIPNIEEYSEVEPDPNRTWQRVNPRSYLGVPLKSKDQVIGTIELVSSKPKGFSEDNLRIMESIAVQASVAVQNAQEVEMREQKLKAQIQELRIEIDQSRKAKHVAEITETEYFQELQQKVQNLRKRPTLKPGEQGSTD